MLRTGYGAAETLLRSGAIFRTVARDTTVARTWAHHLSTKSTATPQLQYASLSARIRQASRAGQPKQFTTSSKRPFQSSRSRRADQKSSESEGPKEKTNGRKKKEPEPTGFSARLKKLSKEYGWTAVGVYLALSVLDFPFCFLLVRTVGTEKIGKFPSVVLHCRKSKHKLTLTLKQPTWNTSSSHGSKRSSLRMSKTSGPSIGPLSRITSGKALVRNLRKLLVGALRPPRSGASKLEPVSLSFTMFPLVVGLGVCFFYHWTHLANLFSLGLATQLALAYAIHKSFIFIRVPLTAAILPKVVKVLRSWGYNIGTKKVAKTVVKKA